MSQQNLAHLCEVSQVAISRWEKGLDRPSPKSLLKISQLATDPEVVDKLRYASGVSDLAAPGKTPAASPIREIPLVAGSVAAGVGRAISGRDIEATLTFPREWLPRGGNIVAVRVTGDSMTPILDDGYIVLIDTAQRDPKRAVERMVAARDGDGITIKWLRQDGDIYMLVPNHTTPRHAVRIMRAEGNASICGVVVKIIADPPKPRK